MSRAVQLGQQTLVCDGAMGTMLHAAGAALDRSLPELNLSDPGLVSTIHESYLSAGADIIQTNTFGANRLWLGDHGLPDQVEEINRAGVRIARAAQDQCEREVLGGRLGLARGHRVAAPPDRLGRTHRGHPRTGPGPGRRTRASTCSSWRRSATSTSWSRRSPRSPA